MVRPEVFIFSDNADSLFPTLLFRPKTRFPSFYTWRSTQVLERVVRSSGFELVMDVLLLINMAGSIYETLDSQINTNIFEAADLVVSVIFVVEVVLKVVVFGPKFAKKNVSP